MTKEVGGGAIKITFAPIKELVIHEAVQIDMEDLLRERITPAGNMPLYWCEGVLFSFTSVPMSKDVMRDYLDGKLHWMEMHYTSMDKYQPVLELNDEGYKATLRIRVIDTNKSSLHREAVRWLKGRR